MSTLVLPDGSLSQNRQLAAWRAWHALHDPVVHGGGSRGALFDTGREHGPEPHPELHARCRHCGRRFPEHDELGTCPEDR